MILDGNKRILSGFTMISLRVNEVFNYLHADEKVGSLVFIIFAIFVRSGLNVYPSNVVAMRQAAAIDGTRK